MKRSRPLILIIEDDPIQGGAINQRLKLEGFNTNWVKNCSDAISSLQKDRPDFVLSDIKLPDGSGEDIFRKAQAWLGDIPILFVTAFGEIDQAVRLVKAGADDYLTKPYDVNELISRIRGRIKKSDSVEPNPGLSEFAVSSATMVIADQLRQAALTQFPILLTGETGTGKEIAARAIHKASTNADQPFVAVNCGAIPAELLESQFFGHHRGAFTGAMQNHQGYFEEAGEGTLFLDEIGELDIRLQSALLRVLEGGSFRPVGATNDLRFTGRIVAATNADLDELRVRKQFRDDLYYRLAVIEINVPPLRERSIEIPIFANRFLQEFGVAQKKKPVMSTSALAAMMDYHWPGNVRELRNRIQRATVFSNDIIINVEDIFPEKRLPALNEPLPETLTDKRKRTEQNIIEQAVIDSEGRVGEAAKKLGISRTTLWKKRRKL